MFNQLKKYFVLKNLLFITIPIVVIVFLSTYFLLLVTKSYSDNIYRTYVNEMMGENLNVFDDFITELSSVVDMLHSDRNVSEFFFDLNPLYKQPNYKGFTNYFSTLKPILQKMPINFITLYSYMNDNIFSTDANQYNKKNILYEYFSNPNYLQQFVYIPDKNSSHLVYIATYRAYGINAGSILFDINLSDLNKQFNLKNINDFILYDDINGTIVFSNDKNLIGTNASDYKKSLGKNTFYEKSSQKNIYSILITPNTKVMTPAMKSFYPMLIFVVISLICIVMFIWLLTKIFLLPTRKMTDIIFKNDKSDINMIKGKVTLDYISEKLNETYKKNNELEEETLKNIQLLNQMHTSALQSQINPHFLFNTLQMINLSIEDISTVKNNDASQMIKLLSQLIRSNFSTRSHLTNLKDEIHHMTAYCNLQNIVYKNKINLQINIPVQYNDLVIPKVTLQPIVENSIIHSLIATKESCDITVGYKTYDDEIEIFVTDNGKGMDKDEVALLNQKINIISEFPESHIGLSNTNQRIKLIFGNNYGITISSIQNVETTVTIKLPLLYSENS